MLPHRLRSRLLPRLLPRRPPLLLLPLARTCNVPDIGGDEVEVTEIMVAVGDMVEADQSIIAVEGDKASMEVPAPFAGRVVEIEGCRRRQGFYRLPGDGLRSGGRCPGRCCRAGSCCCPVAAAAPVAAGAKDVNVPDIGGDEVEVTEIMVAVGDKVEADQSLITVEGDKASMEVPAPFAGVVKEIKVKAGDKVSTGSPDHGIRSGGCRSGCRGCSGSCRSARCCRSGCRRSCAGCPGCCRLRFRRQRRLRPRLPAVRRLAREFGVNLAKVKASGRKGRIVKEDVQAYVKDAVKRAESAPAAGTGTGNGMSVVAWPKVDFSKFWPGRRAGTDPYPEDLRSCPAPQLGHDPHVTQFDEADTTDLEAFRKEQNVLAEKQKLDVKITPLVLHPEGGCQGPGSPSALLQLPVRRRQHSDHEEVHPHRCGGGYPQRSGGSGGSRRQQRRASTSFPQNLAEISKKARAGKLTAADMQGGCFTIFQPGWHRRYQLYPDRQRAGSGHPGRLQVRDEAEVER